MSEVDISTFTISKIRNELKNLGLYTSGTKKELIERYQAYWNEKKGEITEQQTVDEKPQEQPIPVPEEIPADIPTEVEAVPEEQPVVEETIPVEENAPIKDEEVVPAPAEVEQVIEAAPENPVETEQVTEAVPTETETDSFDIEAELDRREARAAKFFVPFDREALRQKLMREHTKQAPSTKMTMSVPAESVPDAVRAARREKFGIPDKDIHQQRREKFGVSKTSDEVRLARQKKFGVVEKKEFTPKGRNMNRRNRGFRKPRYSRVC